MVDGATADHAQERRRSGVPKGEQDTKYAEKGEERGGSGVGMVEAVVAEGGDL